jgi:signal transduction histidine kinase/TolA-binding protein
MFLRILTVLISLISVHLCAQESFNKDSIELDNQTNYLLKKQEVIKDEKALLDSLSKNLSNVESNKTNDFLKYQGAKYFYLKGMLPEALSLTNEAIKDGYSADSQDAKFYNLKGIILTLEKKYDSAISNYLKAVKGYDKGGKLIKEHVVYNNIANIYLALGDFDQAYYYISKCFQVVGKYPENQNYLTMLGILTICEVNLGKLDDAKNHLNELILKVDTTKNILAKVIAYYAQSEYLFKSGDYLNAIIPAEKSIMLSEKYGLNQYVLVGNTLLMKVFNELGDYEKSLIYGHEALRYLETSQNKSVKHSIYQGLAEAHAELSEFKKAYLYQKSADSLRAIDRKLKTRSKLDSLLIAFGTSETQNELLRKEIQIETKDKEIKERNNWILFISLVLIIFLVVGFAVYIYVRQKRILEIEKSEKEFIQAMREGEETERKRISSELHDGLASELTALKIALEKERFEDQRIFNLLFNAHALTRRISHNLAPLQLEKDGFIGAISDFIENNDFENKISFYTNMKGQPKLDELKQTVLYRCIQELIQNAMKHSKAKKVNVQIIQMYKGIQISVEDDGVGFDVQKNFKGVGIASLKERLSSIGAEILIDSTPGHGTSIFINI